MTHGKGCFQEGYVKQIHISNMLFKVFFALCKFRFHQYLQWTNAIKMVDQISEKLLDVVTNIKRLKLDLENKRQI